MLDPNLLNKNLEWVAKKLSRRNFLLNIDRIQQQNNLRRVLQKKTESLQAERKFKSKNIGIAKNLGEDIRVLCQEVDLLAKKLTSIKLENQILQKKIWKYQSSLPNIPDDQIPDGYTDQDNVEIIRWGKPYQYDFPCKDHMILGKLKRGIDTSGAVKISGTRFIIMKGKIANLHRALSQFMINLHTTQHGYEEYYLPYLVNIESLYGSGQLPKFYSDLFHIKSFKKTKINSYTLIPTAEVPLINLMRNVILEEKDLPIKMVAHTPCFRAEAGAYGYKSRGLIRTHQFDKVELIQIVHPDNSDQALEEITNHAEKVLQLLELPYRKMLLCAGNIGFAACKVYDLEVWFPSYNNYYEVSSCSNTKDFQARRIKARFRSKICRKIMLLHILNASGVAVGRTLAAIIENFQLSDGRIKIPSVLRPYMNGIKYID